MSGLKKAVKIYMYKDTLCILKRSYKWVTQYFTCRNLTAYLFSCPAVVPPYLAPLRHIRDKGRIAEVLCQYSRQSSHYVRDFTARCPSFPLLGTLLPDAFLPTIVIYFNASAKARLNFSQVNQIEFYSGTNFTQEQL